MLTETIAICPKCKSGKAFQRYGSEGNFTFIACPLCGFVEIDSRFPEHNTKKSKKSAPNRRILQKTSGDTLV